MTSLYNFTQEDLKKILANKFVVLIGDSVMRTMYKDLVVMIQYGRKLTNAETRTKGEAQFNNDVLIEGGKMTNGKDYREVRQYVSPQHLIRFYFITRVYSGYVETIFADFYKSLKPDIVIVNSCLWDISRYGVNSMEAYKINLQKFCCNLKRLLSSQATIIWTTTLPVSSTIRGGFLSEGTGFLTEILRLDVLVANRFSFQVAKRFGFGVLDLNFLFRQKLHLMARDGVHWMSDAHRDITNILMGYICRALNIVVPNRCRADRLLRFQQPPSYNESLMSFDEPKSFCNADYETEMSYCEGLYNEAPYNDGNSCADNNWAAGDSFDEDGLVKWPKRNNLSPDRNANWLHRNIGKLLHDPEGSSTPILSRVRSRPTDKCATVSSSQSLDKSSRNANPNSSGRSKQNVESKNWADDSDISFDSPPIVQTAANTNKGNKVIWSENQRVEPALKNSSSFKDNWKPYQAGEIKPAQKSSAQNAEKGKFGLTRTFNSAGNERPVTRFQQPHHRRHNSSAQQNKHIYRALGRLMPQLQEIVAATQNFDHHSYQPSFNQYRRRPY